MGGDFVNTPGTNTSFVHNSGLVVLNTTGTSKVIGDTTFDNFTVATGNKKVEFNSGDTFTINGLLTLTGTDTTPIYIDSTEGNNTQWFIDHQGTESIAYVDLNNSGCDAGSTNVSMGYSSKDGSNNDKDCWIFPVINRGGGGGDAGGEVSAPPGDPEAAEAKEVEAERVEERVEAEVESLKAEVDQVEAEVIPDFYLIKLGFWLQHFMLLRPYSFFSGTKKYTF